MFIEECGDMKANIIWLSTLICMVLFGCGCGTTVNMGSSEENGNIIDAFNSDNAKIVNNIEEKAAEDGGKMKADEEMYRKYIIENIQKIIDEAHPEIYTYLDEYEKMYTEEDYEECMKFEKNMILDLEGERQWISPTNSFDEYIPEEEEHDEPLGKYVSDDKNKYRIGHYLGGYQIKEEHNNPYVFSVINQYDSEQLAHIRMYLMHRGAAEMMTYFGVNDYSVLKSNKDLYNAKVFENNIDDANSWYWFDGEDMFLLCDMNRIEKKNSEGEYCGVIYEYSVLAICHLNNGKYIVEEVIPLKMQ